MISEEKSRQDTHFGESILIIDDDPLLLKINRRRLEPLGFKVATFSNGKSAYEDFQKKSKEYDLVITDQTMPGLLGLDLISKIHKIRPEIPVIICTGHSDMNQDKIDHSKGKIKFVFKPIQEDELIAAVISM